VIGIVANSHSPITFMKFRIENHRPAIAALALIAAALSATPHAAGQPFTLQGARATISRWNYLASDFSAGTRATASVFGALGDGPDFDSRDAQYLLGWNTTNLVPAGRGARNYLIRRARVTLTIASGGQYSYTGVLRDYRTYFPTNDARYIAPASGNYPVELFGAGFRGGFTNEQNVYVPWAATNYPQTGPWSAGPSGVYSSVRAAYAAGFDTNGVLADVSNNVSDNGTTELGNPFEVAPFAVGQTTNVAEGEIMPAGSQLTFDLNLDDPLIYGYLQRGLNDGNLSFVATCFVMASQAPAPPTYPTFYTIFSQIASPDQFPLLEIEGAVVRDQVDSDTNGLADDWENFHFGSLLNSATGDADGDGHNNLAEFNAGTVPTSATNSLRILTLDRKPDASELHFTFAPSRNYTVLWSTNLLTWEVIANTSLHYSSAWLSKSVSNPTYPSPVFAVWKDMDATNGARFYRVSAN
jgi:hypothetical protein